MSKETIPANNVTKKNNSTSNDTILVFLVKSLCSNKSLSADISSPIALLAKEQPSTFARPALQPISTTT